MERSHYKVPNILSASQGSEVSLPHS